MTEKRSFDTIIQAIVQRRHYRALKNTFYLYQKPIKNLWRYLTYRGTYPYQLRLRTPLGWIDTTLFSYHDLLTVNEVFCRLDYPLDRQQKVVVDIGSNIGISALYFLTRNPNNKIYLFEPLPLNIERLKRNLKGFESRYQLSPSAVADFNGVTPFFTENSGRYGKISETPTHAMNYPCIHINTLLEKILTHEHHIDLLKIDVEGYETKLLTALHPTFLKRINMIYLENEAGQPFHFEEFTSIQTGNIHQYFNRNPTQGRPFQATKNI